MPIRFLFTLLLLGSTLINLTAQPELKSDEMLGYGSIMHLKYVSSFEVIDTTIQGTNALWDFSDLEESNYSDDLFVEIVDPASTPNGAEFPNSNYAYKETPLLNYRYFILDDIEMQRVGSDVNGQLNFYTNPQTELVFPLGVGTSNNDTWDNTNSSFGGEYNFSCIGSGTLILPSGTYEDALLVRVVLIELSEIPIYFWYSSKNGAILLEYTEGDGIFVGEFGLQLINLDVMVGTAENNFVEKIIYNNPVETTLNVNLFSNDFPAINYNLVDINGQVLRSDQLVASNQKHQQIQLDMSQMGTGMYFLQLHSKDAMQTYKIVKL